MSAAPAHRTQPHGARRQGGRLRIIALATLAAAGAALAGVFALASSQGAVVAPIRYTAITRTVLLDRVRVLEVTAIAVRHLGTDADAQVTCQACRRPAAPPARLTRTGATMRFAKLDWLMTPGSSIALQVTKPGVAGRIVVLAAGPRRRLARRSAGCLTALGAPQACPGATATTTTTTTATATAAATAEAFDSGVGALQPQCAPLTPSKSPRLRGTYALEHSFVGQGLGALEITLPTDTDRATFPLEACGLITRPAPVGLGSDGYYGLMIYVPAGWTIANSAFFGVEVYELHFQNIYGAPISLQVHPNHVTIAIETGACDNHTTARPGCMYRSNADAPHGTSPTLPGYYAIPPGAFVQGAWNEIVLHVHWANTDTGIVQSYYRLAGASSWRTGSTVSGIPTVQWDAATGCCEPNADNQLEAYTAALSAPLSIWLDDVVDGTSLAAVQAAMP